MGRHMDHPRRRGEHSVPHAAGLAARGSSPQARGTRVHRALSGGKRRIIPAGAGNTGFSFRRARASSDHPRRRGEHGLKKGRLSIFPGSSPQARGTPPVVLAGIITGRIIPAGAGNTCGRAVGGMTTSDHPRRRGEHYGCPARTGAPHGSSPQARGTRLQRNGGRTPSRIIPAGAGNTHPRGDFDLPRADHPRRRGEHYCPPDNYGPDSGSSPQARGTLPGCVQNGAQQRIIPAGAGNTSSEPKL